jgi:hypothetical protein
VLSSHYQAEGNSCLEEIMTGSKSWLSNINMKSNELVKHGIAKAHVFCGGGACHNKQQNILQVSEGEF